MLYTVAHSGEPYGTLRMCWHGGNGGGRYRNDLKIFFRVVGMQIEPYGGRIGGAMIKYPHTKKNAQRPKRALYPDLGYNYLYVLLRDHGLKGPGQHRAP